MLWLGALYLSVAAVFGLLLRFNYGGYFMPDCGHIVTVTGVGEEQSETGTVAAVRCSTAEDNEQYGTSWERTLHFQRNLLPLLLLILIDMVGAVRLWGERFLRRYVHHIQNVKCYQPFSRKALLQSLPQVLDEEQITALNAINDADDAAEKDPKNGKSKRTNLNTQSTCLSKLSGGQYSKKATIYYGDMSDADKKTVDAIAEQIRPKLESVLGLGGTDATGKLELGSSDFRCTLLRYEGADAAFTWHYDTEPFNCFRFLALIKSEGTVPPFTYLDQQHRRHELHFQKGDGLVFQGTQTYHGVLPAKDQSEETVRHMVGFQFRCGPDLESADSQKNMCNGFRGESVMNSFFMTQSRCCLAVILPLISCEYLLKYLTLHPTAVPLLRWALLDVFVVGPWPLNLIGVTINKWALIVASWLVLVAMCYVPSRMPVGSSRSGSGKNSKGNNNEDSNSWLSCFKNLSLGTHIDNNIYVYASFFFGPTAAVLYFFDPTAAVFIGAYIFATEGGLPCVPTSWVDFLHAQKRIREEHVLAPMRKNMKMNGMRMSMSEHRGGPWDDTLAGRRASRGMDAGFAVPPVPPPVAESEVSTRSAVEVGERVRLLGEGGGGQGLYL